MKKELKKAAVLGAGTMGHAIGMMLARRGLEVTITDVEQEILDKAVTLIRSHLETFKELGEQDESPDAVMARISTSTEYESPVSESDYVVEAIIENVDAKRVLFHDLAKFINKDTIVASNTSYLDVFSLAPPELQKQLLIAHYFSPPYIAPLVELVPGPETGPEFIDRAKELADDMGLISVVLKKYVPGFIVNRIQRAIGREILHMIDQGYAEPAEVDKAVKASVAIRMPIVGVFGRMDFAGLDMLMRAMQNPSIGLAVEDKVPPQLQELIDQGHYGAKTGKGFFDYSHKPLPEILKERDMKMMKIRKLMEELGEI